MKTRRKILLLLICTLLMAFVLTLVFNSYLINIIKYGKSDVDDYKIFQNDTLFAQNHVPWKRASNYNKKEISDSLKTVFEHYETLAFLVIQDNKIKFEKYYKDANNKTIINSFSVAKTIVSLLIGIAIDRGYISSVDDKIGNYLTRYKNKQITIKHLLTMSSGSNWKEVFINPFSDVVEAYYTDDLSHLRKNIDFKYQQGVQWNYQCGNTLLLCEIIEKASNMSIIDFTQRYLWNKINVKNNALWSTDRKNGIIKSFCCFHSTALDFARLGSIVLNNGVFNGRYILSKNYIDSMINPTYLFDNEKNKINYYGYHIWIMHHRNYEIPYFRGMWGQYIFIIPEKNAIIVRLGKKRTEVKKNGTPLDAYSYINAALEILD